MWNRLALCVVLAACGFRSSVTGGDGSVGGGSDAAIDGAGGGSGDGSSAAADCWPHWMDGSVTIDASTVQEITELSSAGDDRHPWISDDGLRMYFSRDLTPGGHGDIYFTRRNFATGTFGTASPAVELNSPNDEGRAWLTPDELTIAISTAHDGSLDIHMISRPAGVPFGTPDARHLMMVNARGTVRFDPFVTPDLLRLYWSANSQPNGRLELLVATRANASADFGTPAEIPGIDDPGTNVAGPVLYQDERLLLFSSGKGPADLWYATRSSATAGFGGSRKIPTVNTGASELDPVLSHDGCELYFASDRDAGGRFHLFHATVMPRS